MERQQEKMSPDLKKWKWKQCGCIVKVKIRLLDALIVNVGLLFSHSWVGNQTMMDDTACQTINQYQADQHKAFYLFLQWNYIYSYIPIADIFCAPVFMISPCWVSLLHLPRATGRGEYISSRGFYQQCSYTQKYKSTDKHPNTFSFLFQLVKMQQFCDFLSAAGQVFAESRSKREPQGWFVPKVFQCFPMFSKVFHGF